MHFSRGALILMSMVIASSAFAGLPPRDEFFAAAALDVPAGKASRYVFGDNLAGYYEGYTFGYERGSGYIMKKAALFSDFAVFFSDKLAEKSKAVSAKLLPYGIRHEYGGGTWDELVLLPRAYALIVAAHADTPQTLGILPFLYCRASAYTANERTVAGTRVLVLSPKAAPKKPEYPEYVALAADRACRLELVDEKNRPEVKRPLRLAAGNLKYQYQTTAPATDLRVTVAFGWSADEAARKAASLSGAAALERRKDELYRFLSRSYLWTDDADYNKALVWSALSSYFLVVEEFGKGIWAGLPWFKNNWGRDTFISLPGTLLVTGAFDEALSVMTNFSTFQNKTRGSWAVEAVTPDPETRKKTYLWLKKEFGYASGTGLLVRSVASGPWLADETGLKKKLASLEKDLPGVKTTYKFENNKLFGRIPNLVSSLNNIIYNTTDGTPWFLREMWEYLRYTGDTAFAKTIYPVVVTALEGSIANWVDKDGLLTHDDADTWMDARIGGNQPWSARGNRANDIQVLWFTALQAGVTLARINGDAANAARWESFAARAKDAYLKRFWDPKKRLMADRVREDGTPDFRVRPNQLLLLSVPFGERFLSADVEADVLRNAVSELLFPHGICSLSQKDPFFHPYHEKWDKYEKDSAYHNGTIWGWNAGPTVTGLARFGYADLAWELAKNLGAQVRGLGCLGAMSELLDAFPQKNGQPKPSGTWSQAWSSAEFARNGLQDFGGFQPNLLADEVTLIPAVPEAWKKYVSAFAFGNGATFTADFQRLGDEGTWTLKHSGHARTLDVRFVVTVAGAKHAVTFKLAPGKTTVLRVNLKRFSATRDGAAVTATPFLPSFMDRIGKLEFAKPRLDGDFETLGEKDYLKKIILKGNYR